MKSDNMKIAPEQIKLISNNCKLYNLDAYFGKEWMESNLKVEKTEDMPTLFWVLSSEEVCKDLTANLDVLSHSFAKYETIINKLKDDKKKNKKRITYNGLQGILTEIEVLAFYYKKYPSSLEFEPKVPVGDKIKRPDIKLDIDGQKFFIEIKTILKDESEQLISDLEDKIGDIIRKENLTIDLHFHNFISENDFEGIYNFIEGILTNPKKSFDTSYLYKIEGIPLIEIFLINGHNNKHSMISTNPIMENPYGRLKNKILEKLERNQLPENSTNVLIIKARPESHIYPRYVSPVFYGVNGEKKGIIHESSSKKLSLLIFYRDNYAQREKFPNPNASNIIEEYIWNKL